MFFSRQFCSQLTRQITEPSRYACPSERLLLHHATRQPRQSFQKTMLRAFRNSGRQEQLKPTVPEAFVSGGPVPSRNIIKALIFTGTFTTGCFMAATVLEYELARRHMLDRARQSKVQWFFRKSMTDARTKWDEIKREVQHYYDQLSTGSKVFAPICALNLIVFGLWRVNAMRGFMMKYFVSNPAAKAVCWPMFLSTFSHYSAFHIFANMYVLHSFCNVAVATLGKEQFLAVYLSAGVIASLASILYKAAISQAGFSIGASGAIMAILAFVCTLYPDTQLSILFLPTLTFSAGAAIKVIMGFDLAGLVLGWKIFDHAAHLGGALFGLLWAYYGIDIWSQRLPFLRFYHDLRKTKS